MKRRIIADRRKLAEILFDAGYEIDGDGDFVLPDSEELSFTHSMWGYTGKEVVPAREFYIAKGGRSIIPFRFRLEWTELVEEEEEVALTRAPQTIYLQWSDDNDQYETTWSEDRVHDTDIRYVREDKE